ncbi:IgGFc-binding protein-like [Branchiostoma lanceolatum]|uniref:IgGFc-binding protein-like n=1 Tax=Branchiostoma lanceolatum TaxID=7740 RepID=UPI003451FBFA
MAELAKTRSTATPVFVLLAMKELIVKRANVDECASDPCQNGGTCEDEVDGYNYVDECASDPCQNGGTCEDEVDGYTCICAAGYEGTHCETDVDECASDPCQNGGTCEDEVDGYTCICAAGYEGTHCETDVDECASDPCQNGGTCEDEVDGYTCICAAGYEGDHCETGEACCTASGDPHYYLFDGGAHHFQGPCRYTLAKDCGNSSDFSVTTQNRQLPHNPTVSAVREVFVEAHGFVVGVHQGRIVTVGGPPAYSLPFTLAGGAIDVSLSGWSVRVLLTNFSVEVFYDGSHSVKVKVPSDYWGQMCGLCGNYNGDTSDDYMTPDGTIVGDWTTFGNSWITDDETCPGGMQPTPPPPCSDAVRAAAESTDNCGLLKDLNGPFAVCHGTVDPAPFFNDCVFDMCAWNGNTIGLCQNLEVYADACRAAGVAPFSWRTEERCPRDCPPNSMYSTCVSNCPATCPNPNAEEECSRGCGEGCKCNPGFLLSGQQCVPQEQCGCTDDAGRYYMLGERWREDGENCVCDAGNVITCVGEACCTASGDPHYYLFDGGAHHFQGPCRYTLAKDCGNSSDFSVTTQNRQLPYNPTVSAVREVFVEAHGFVVGVHQGRIVTVGGPPAYSLPFTLAGGAIDVSLSGWSVRVLLTNFGVEVFYDGSHSVKVKVPGDYWGQMCGLCGNYNGDSSDDYMTPDGTIVGDWTTFGNSWITDDETCPGGMQPTPPPPCSDAVRAAAESTDNCGLLKDLNGPFAVCHGTVDPAPFFNDCVFDMCAWNGNTIGLCQNLEAYADACRAAGVAPFSWRTEERCPRDCPPNSMYSTCVSNCPATCPNPNAEEECSRGCGEGCKCNPGFLLSGQQCVPQEQCGCTDDAGRYYMLGERWREDGENCVCDAGNVITCVGEACCTASGDPHYYLFDGGAHHFQGPCRYTLAKDCGNSSDFSVTTQNRQLPYNPTVSAVREVFVEAHGFVVGVHQGRIVTVGGPPAYSLPFTLAGGAIDVSLSGWSVRVLLTNFSVEVFYDGSHSVKVKVPSDYWGQMCGLCGNYNGDTSDDYMTPDGTIVGDWTTFGNSWITDDETCPGGMQPTPPPPCSDAVRAAAESTDNCGLLKDLNGPFAVCHGTVDPAPFFNDCVFDMCAWNGNTIGLCQNLEAYADACRAAGVAPFSWRTEERCPRDCPPNSMYSTCVSNCPATCPNPNAEEECSRGCGEGCKCNPGFLLSGQQCVPQEQCGCTDDAGRYYMLGERWREDGENCVCDAGNVITCVGEACCTASGDPHYYLFDGGAHHFQGPCRYTLAKDCGNSSDFSVTTQNRQLPYNPTVSAVREVFVEAHGFVVGVHQGRIVTVGGPPAYSLPFTLAGGAIDVSLSGWSVRVLLTNFGVEVFYDGSHSVKVKVPSDYWGQMCGLCGNYNGDTSDDYMTPDGTIVGDWTTFGNSWITDNETCPGGMQPTPPPPCSDAVRAAAESTDNCGLLKDLNGPFAVCHGTVDPAPFFNDCVFDMCAWNGNTIGLCQNLEAYADACRAAGVAPFSWRTEERCPRDCPPNSMYSTCVSNCPATCPNPNAEEECSRGCGEGCKCDPGFLLSGQQCVPQEQCGCTDDKGRYYIVSTT